MKPRTLVLLIALAALAGIGWTMRDAIPFWGDRPAGDAALGRGGSPSGAPRGPGGRRSLPVPILAEAARAADVPVYLDGVGTVRAYKTVTVRAQVSGRLLSVNFKEGQDVRKGDVLAKIDPVTYQAALDQAVAKKAMDQASLDNARRDLERYTSLARGDFASKQQADTQRAAVAQAEAQVRQDQAAIDSAQASLDYTTITAPIDGRTGIRQIDEGNLVSSGDETGLVVITQLRPISVLFTLPETVVSEVATAKGPLSVTASIGSQQLDAGVLEVIDNQVDQATGTVKMKGTFENAQGRLWPGQFVNVRLLLKTLGGAIVVPAASVQQGTVGSFVYVVQPDDTVKLTPVRITQQNETQAVIAGGLDAGQQVVTSGFANLQDGSRITLSSGEPATASEPNQGNQRRRRNASAAEPASTP
ncbi:efflux RND transporter periplasmic adaptor subunit [Microvirga pudoricolor]|uniref:efflux RND transporter periplasmic adaptor subunit n=1 Tax=Microvirga pudoricolor TaxID=2778729 RepID=UPI00194F98FD|nr:efflux RND transporter periplasmic adaptor subunit [Microvirga pudoricolor]MBM6595169.1 efflux RND transporter periplasmic adaptor subunit [Microvirga pudoricolor]